MILMYHKVDIIAPTLWWVSRDAFAAQMQALARMRVVHLADYAPDDPEQCVITFDDAYENVYRHAFPILRARGYPFELFVNGDLLGRWNGFDVVEPRTRFCGIDHLLEMAEAGARVQWHTRSHANLVTVSPDEAEREIEVAADLRRRFDPPHLDWFAYPYGAHTPALVDRVRERFEGAVSVDGGNDRDRFQLNRVVVTGQTVIGADSGGSHGGG